MLPQGVRTRRRSHSVLRFEHKHMRTVLLDCNIWCLECDEIITVGAVPHAWKWKWELLMTNSSYSLSVEQRKHFVSTVWPVQKSCCIHWHADGTANNHRLRTANKTHLMHAIRAAKGRCWSIFQPSTATDTIILRISTWLDPCAFTIHFNPEWQCYQPGSSSYRCCIQPHLNKCLFPHK